MSKGRQIAKNIGKSLKKKLETDLFQFPFGIDDHQKDIVYLQTPYSVSPQRSPPLSTKKSRKMQSPRSPKKSNSLTTIAPQEKNHPGIVDHDEIIALTHDVKKFSDSLARLKVLFTEGFDEEDDPRVVTHEILGEVLSVLNPLMQHYPELQSPDIFTAARSLITMIKDHNYEEDVTATDLHGFCEAIDQLALAFSSSVSEYLMGDMGPQMLMDYKTQSMNNIAGADALGNEPEDTSSTSLSAKELDSILVDLDSGLTLALQRAKAWSKYVHGIISYMEKKAQLEYDYAKNLSRLVHSVQNNLKKEGFLPLQSVYCTALAHDEEFVINLQATQSILHKFIEPLITRRSEHDKVYKAVKEAWHREHRRMADSVTNLRKAQALYQSRQQDHERARELSLKAEGDKQEKRRKAEEEMMHKAAEAETTYKACVAEANYRQQELFKVKRELLTKIREQIEKCDQVIKNVTVEYFQLCQTVVSPLPLQNQTLSDSSKTYVPGSQYAEYMRRLPPISPKVQPPYFMFEPYIHGTKSSHEASRKESVHSNGSMSDPTHSPDGSPITSPRRDKYRMPVKAWSHGYGHGGHSDTDSASCSSKSHESSPSGSPQGPSRRHLVTSQSLDELTEEELIAAAAAASSYNGKDKRAQMKRTITLQGDSTDIPEMLYHRGRRNTTFGVDFQEQVDAFQTKVPPIISKCLVEIEKRGLMIKGIYRVSGVKSKVEHLCQRFDIDPEAVALEDVHPNIISNVLKLYLRQLPEPLLTFRLYSDFIHVAKANMSGQLKGEELIECLRKLAKRLPSSNMKTCAVLMHHLQRVAAHSDLNQMNASNLGIVFGPTLLRPLEGSASLASLVDTPHQTRAIELLIFHAQFIFGPSEDFQIAPNQTPIEQLRESQSGVLLSDKTDSDKKGIPQITRSLVSESDESSVSVFESSSSSPDPRNATQPSASEYVLPGSANIEQTEFHSLSSHGLELTLVDSRSDEDEDFPEIHLPDQSKPQSEPLSVVLSPRCVSGNKEEVHFGQPGGSTLGPPLTSKAAVPKSASSPVVSGESQAAMPSSLSAPVAVSCDSGDSSSDYRSSKEVSPYMDHMTTEAFMLSPKTNRMHESHSTGDLICRNDKAMTDEVKSGNAEMMKKKPHSQKLENIKFLTKAPSMDEVTGIMEELVVKSGNLSPNLSQRSPHGQSKIATKSNRGGTEEDLKITENQPVKFELSSVPEDQRPSVCEGEVPTPLGIQSKKQVELKDEPAPSVPSPHHTTCQSKVLRKSILEEVPIPTVSSQPFPHSDESKTDRKETNVLPVTIPASPTIKRREIPTKIPSSPITTRNTSTDSKIAETRSSQESEGDRANRFRQEQRKLVSAIKTGAVKGSSSRPGSNIDLAEIGEKKAVAPSDQRQENILTGGCALVVSSRPGFKDMEQSPLEVSLGIETSSKIGSSDLRMNSSQEPSSVEVENMSPAKAQSKSNTFGLSKSGSTHVGNAKQDQTTVKQSVASSDGTDKYGSKSRGTKPRTIALPSTVFTKKEASSASTPTSTSSLSKSSASEKSPSKPSSSSHSSSLVKQRSFSSSSKEQSPIVCPRAIAITKSMEGKISKSSQSPKTVMKSSDVSPMKTPKNVEGEIGKGDSSPHSKHAPPSGSPALTKTRVRRASGGSPSSKSPTSSPKRSTVPVQRKSSTGGVVVVSSRRTQEKQMMASGHSQSTSRSVQSSVSSQSSFSASSPSSNTTTTSGSGRLSQDRTPRFV